ncbi:MAG: hypothetical protein JKX69_00520, partial [Rhodobacteraceae bacterium]|nr:hypothetical protein [Paracoccaceae bacterium]
MLKQPLFFAVALSLAASAAFAQERGAQFLDMVGALPADIVGNTADGFFTGGLLDFSDFRAGADALAQVPADNPGGFSPELQIYIRVTNAGLDPTSFQFGEQWQDLVGF